MATTNPAVYRLSIALIVFVLLTFILTISTYLFFSQYSKEQQTAKEARDALSKAQGEANQAAEEIKRLRDVIGADATAKLDDIESGLKSLYETDFNGVAKEPRSYATLVDAIRDEFRAINAARKDVEAAKEQQKKTADDAVAAATKARDDADNAKVEVEKQRDTDRSKWDDDWKKHEEELAKSLKLQGDAEAKSMEFKALVEEVAKFEDFLPVESRADFRAKMPIDQFRMFYDAYKKVFYKNEANPEQSGQLRLAQEKAARLAKEYHDTLIALGPEKEQSRDINVVNEIDGRIVDVDSTTGTVTILFPESRRQPREGLAFMVFPANSANPLLTDQKGVVRIVSTEGPLVRAKIFQEGIKNPISPNDGVANRLWSAAAAPEVVVTGFVDKDRYGIQSRRALEALLERAGARIERSVQPTTEIVVDAGPPRGQVEDAAKLDSDRRKELDMAGKYGHQVIGIEEAVLLLGIDPVAAGIR